MTERDPLLADGDLPLELRLQQHGDSDTEVPSEHSRQLVGRLLAAGREAELMLVPGAGHVFAGADPTPVVARTVAFFANRLGASVTPTTAVGERS